jgi:chloramphenicol 3-O phosphotransferase
MTTSGQIVVLNGVPRSGKSSIAAALQATSDGVWMNLGVDAFEGITPARYLPGIGLRPGGERPDLEALVPELFAALYESVLAQSSLGFNVVVDVGHHDDYSTPLGILDRAAERLMDHPAYFIGIRCPVEVIMDRRAHGEDGREGRYETSDPRGEVPAAVRRWERAVHEPGLYDLEVDTSTQSPEECVRAIATRLREPPTAFRQLARRWSQAGPK